MNAHPKALLLPWLLVAALAGCRSSAVPPDGSAGADPKVNAPFLDPELDVDLWSKRFEGESREVWRARDAIINELAITPGMVVADVGTGTGLFVKGLSEAVGPEGKVIAVDISPKFIARVQSRIEEAGLHNAVTRLGTMDDPGLKPASVDLAFLCDVYHHFEDPAAVLAHLRSALRPGGRLAVIEFHRIPGKTSDFIMDHVRAGPETFIAEIEAAGFVRLPDPETPYLDENYLVLFE